MATYWRPLKSKSGGCKVFAAHCAFELLNMIFFLQLYSFLHYSTSSGGRSLSNSAFSFFVRELFREELQLPVQAASRPSKKRTSTPPPAVYWMASPLPSSRLGTSGLSPPPVTHATTVNMYVGVGGSLAL